LAYKRREEATRRDIHVLEHNREQSTSVWEIERIEKKKATDSTTRRKNGSTLGIRI